jgi:hypothetical protein
MPLPRILMVGPFRAWPSLVSALSQNAILLVVNLDPAHLIIWGRQSQT